MFKEEYMLEKKTQYIRFLKQSIDIFNLELFFIYFIMFYILYWFQCLLTSMKAFDSKHIAGKLGQIF